MMSRAYSSALSRSSILVDFFTQTPTLDHGSASFLLGSFYMPPIGSLKLLSKDIFLAHS